MNNKYEEIKKIIKPLLNPDWYPIEAHEEVSGRVAKRICELFDEHIETGDCWCEPRIISIPKE